MENNFCIFIISNGRPDNVITYKTLKNSGCKLPLYIVIDNTDDSKNKYVSNFGESTIIIFDKLYYSKLIDNFDNFGNLRSTTHARNACFDIAEQLGYQYFLVLDDDYTKIDFRINSKLDMPTNFFKCKKNIDTIFLLTLDFFKNTKCTSICFSQGGDWFGGKQFFNKKPKRKAMNSFFCDTKRRFWFISRLNEDVNTYMTLGNIGNVFLSIPFISITQNPTQLSTGGMSAAYLEGGTYIKSFYTVMCRPDCTHISIMGLANVRLHHSIKWEYAVPYIISEKYKK